jgi:hypothetical protein
MITTINEWKVYEAYLKMADLSWATPKDLIDDAKIALKHLLPTWDDKYIAEIVDETNEQGIKLRVELSNGGTIHMYRTGKFRSSDAWDYFLNKKKIMASDLKSYMRDNLATKVELFLNAAPGYDFNIDRIDDGSAHRKGTANNAAILQMYQDLSEDERIKALADLKMKLSPGQYEQMKQLLA